MKSRELPQAPVAVPLAARDNTTNQAIILGIYAASACLSVAALVSLVELASLILGGGAQ